MLQEKPLKENKLGRLKTSKKEIVIPVLRGSFLITKTLRILVESFCFIFIFISFVLKYFPH